MYDIAVKDVPASTGLPGAIAVASTGTIRTHSVSMKDAEGLTLLYKATVASGTPDIDLYLEQGPGAPTAEGSVGDASDGWVQVGSKIADVTDELWHSITLAPQYLPFLRIMASGQGSNPATCTLTLKLGKLAQIN